jgi:hypothetical protein
MNRLKHGTVVISSHKNETKITHLTLLTLIYINLSFALDIFIIVSLVRIAATIETFE